MGSALPTVTTKLCPPWLTRPLLNGVVPLAPAAAGWHGLAKSACVALWPGPKAAKLKTTCPPTGTVTVSGLKTRPPAPTEMVGAAAAPVAVAATGDEELGPAAAEEVPYSPPEEVPY